MDIGFVGGLLLLLLITAGPVLLILLFIGYLISIFTSIRFFKLLVPISLIFLPIHIIIMFYTNPKVPVDLENTFHYFLISAIYTVPLIVIYIIQLDKEKRTKTMD